MDLRKNIPLLSTILCDLQRSLGHPLPLSSYLHKPVQRILKYHLILKVGASLAEWDSGKPYIYLTDMNHGPDVVMLVKARTWQYAVACPCNNRVEARSRTWPRNVQVHSVQWKLTFNPKELVWRLKLSQSPDSLMWKYSVTNCITICVTIEGWNAKSYLFLANRNTYCWLFTLSRKAWWFTYYELLFTSHMIGKLAANSICRIC